MKIPKSVKVGGIVYEVVYADHHEIDCDAPSTGDQNDFQQRIRIAKGLTKEMSELTFIHELLHCINPQMEHSEVEYLASALHQVIHDNDLI